MCTATSASVMDDHESEKDSRTEHSPSRFTAVNGKESLTSGTASSPCMPGGSLNNDGHRDPSENWKRNEMIKMIGGRGALCHKAEHP
ncbi:hypothetical protein EYZ11_005923 [Aspergillus tanneri]|uniref:Uncharacterized protein n=1 Tax=Aspergillus tanneri TaxID=1220188 RepID=A0A4S3JH68_9EURO|nr:hypothetical protein EYZ11_005923 [Aspergillus tanneri]